MRFLLGLILGVLLVPVALMVYFHFGQPPVAVADKPFPMERQIVKGPLAARIEKEIVGTAPIEASATNLEARAAACAFRMALPRKVDPVSSGSSSPSAAAPSNERSKGLSSSSNSRSLPALWVAMTRRPVKCPRPLACLAAPLNGRRSCSAARERERRFAPGH